MKTLELTQKNEKTQKTKCSDCEGTGYDLSFYALLDEKGDWREGMKKTCTDVYCPTCNGRGTI